MKSKTLYSKMIIETIKRQKWVTALISLVMFFLYPIMGLMSIDQWINVQELSHAEAAERFAQYFLGTGEYYSGNSLQIFLAAVFLGVLSAVNGFSFLHSRNKVDFYHSLPVRRRKLLTIQGCASTVCFIIPSLICILLMILLGSIRGLFSLEALGGMAAVFGISILFFLLAYEMGAAAMLLTGRVLVGILGAGTFLFYPAIIDFLVIGYSRSYYYTMSSHSSKLSTWFSLPTLAVEIGERMVLGEQFLGAALLMIPVILILGLLCVWLYGKRPSEAAGRSMAFPKAANVIKILLVIPASLITGLLFLKTINSGSDFWLIFGLIFGLLVFYGIIQMIYQLDFKSIFAQKHHLIIAAVAVGVIAAVFRFDLTGHDSYLPKQEDIQNINVYTSGIFSTVSDMAYAENDTLDGMRMGNSAELYQLAQSLVEDAEKLDKNGLDESGSWMNVSVLYTLNSGRKVYRTYTVFPEDVKGDLAALLDNEDFLDMVCPLRTQDLEKIKDVRVGSRVTQEGALADGSSKQKKLLQALQKDLQEMDGKSISEEIPLAHVYYMYSKNNQWQYGGAGMMAYIYPEFTETLAVLKEFDMDLSSVLDYEDVRKVTVYSVESDGEVYNEVEEAEYTSRKDIDDIMPKLIEYDAISIWNRTVEGKTVTVDTNDGSFVYKILE